MTQHKVERAVVTGAEAVGSALEMFERRIIDRFNSILEAERSQWLDMRDMVAAVATQVAEQRTEERQRASEMLAGITGLSQQLSEYEALIPPAERVKIAAMVYRLDTEMIDLAARVTALEAARGDANQ